MLPFTREKLVKRAACGAKQKLSEITMACEVAKTVVVYTRLMSNNTNSIYIITIKIETTKGNTVIKRILAFISGIQTGKSNEFRVKRIKRSCDHES